MPPRRTPSSVAALMLIVGLTSWFLWIGVDTIGVALDPGRIDPEERWSLGLSGVGFQDAGVAYLLIGITVLAVCLVALLILGGLWRRRAWARESALFVFGVLAALSVILSIAGLVSEPPGPNAGLGIALGAADGLVVALLLAPGARREFELVEHERQRRLVRGTKLSGTRLRG